jgi:class 3 adenylate cyclase
MGETGIDAYGSYLPWDRRLAEVEGRQLPERSSGSALFADISGFTPLTAALTRTLGLRRGAEELPRHLNRVYDALIEQVHAFGGSVIGFSGDAITCWFDRDDGRLAVACALQMQVAMEAFAHVPLPDGTNVELAAKVAVSRGPMRRFAVGDPDIQRMDVIAGETVARLAAAEGQAQRGEVVLDEQTAVGLQEGLGIREWRNRAGVRVAVVGSQPATDGPPVGRSADAITAAAMAAGPGDAADGDKLRAWLLPTVFERLQAGQGEFLTELRSATALFLSFTGIDYDGDDQAGAKLDAFVRWVQAEAKRLDGALIQLTIGDKGSYLYLNFGAPRSHEDDAVRAAAMALVLQSPPAELGFVREIRIAAAERTAPWATRPTWLRA